MATSAIGTDSDSPTAARTFVSDSSAEIGACFEMEANSISKIADGWLDAFLVDYRTRLAGLATIAGGEAADAMLIQMESMLPDIVEDIKAMRRRRGELDALIGTNDKAAAMKFVDDLDGDIVGESI